MLEAAKHSASVFVTLTYDNVHLPSNGSLIPRDVTLWLKRFRKVTEPVTFRYFLVGEYGDRSFRPHYHLAMFGIDRGYEDLAVKTWGKGHVMFGDLTPQSASYIAGYVTKKMTSSSDPRLGDLHPEFTRMSNRPGIGAAAMDDLAAVLLSEHGESYFLDNGDVPMTVLQGGAPKPLGRYLRRKLREKLGWSPDTPDAAFNDWLEKMLALRQDIAPDKKISFKKILKEKSLQHSRNMQARNKLYDNKNRGVL